MKLSTISQLVWLNIKIRSRRLIGKESRPYKLLIQVTNDCNSKCSTCFIWSINQKDPEQKKQELSLDQYESLFKQIGSDLFWLALGGGETSLYRDFKKLIDLAVKHCPQLKLVTFTTNGIQPDVILQFANYLRLKNLDCFIVVSLDGDPETHDRIRGIKGNHALACKTFELLKAERIPTYFGITVSPYNADFIKNSYKLHRSSMKAISLVHSDGIYRRKNIINDDLNLQSLKVISKSFQLKKVSEIIEYFYLLLGQKFLKSKRDKLPVPCEVMTTSIHISPHGDLLPCMFLPSLGNLKQSNYWDLLNSSQAREVRKRIKEQNCPKCWMNCYAPHSMMLHPIKTLKNAMAGEI